MTPKHPCTGSFSRVSASYAIDFTVSSRWLGSTCFRMRNVLLTPNSLCTFAKRFGWSAGKYGDNGQSGAHLRRWYLHAAQAVFVPPGPAIPFKPETSHLIENDLLSEVIILNVFRTHQRRSAQHRSYIHDPLPRDTFRDLMSIQRPRRGFENSSYATCWAYETKLRNPCDHASKSGCPD